MTPTEITIPIRARDFTALVKELIQDKPRSEVSGAPHLDYATFPTLTGCAVCGGITGYMRRGQLVVDRATGWQLSLIQWGFHVGRREGQEGLAPVARGGGSIPYPCTCTCDHQWTVQRHDMHRATWTCHGDGNGGPGCGETREVDSSD